MTPDPITPVPAPLTDGEAAVLYAMAQADGIRQRADAEFIAAVLRRYGLEPDGVLDAAACDVERVVAADRERLAVELAEAQLKLAETEGERDAAEDIIKHVERERDTAHTQAGRALEILNRVEEALDTALAGETGDDPDAGLIVAVELLNRQRDAVRAELAAAHQAPWMVQDGGDWYLNHAHPAIEKLRAILAVDGDADYALDVLVRWGDALAAEPPASSQPTPGETEEPPAEVVVRYSRRNRCRGCGRVDGTHRPTCILRPEEYPAEADHPHADPGDGRTECQTCGKYVWPAIHSCKGVPVTERAKARYAEPVSVATGDTQDDEHLRPGGRYSWRIEIWTGAYWEAYNQGVSMNIDLNAQGIAEYVRDRYLRSDNQLWQLVWRVHVWPAGVEETEANIVARVTSRGHKIAKALATPGGGQTADTTEVTP